MSYIPKILIYDIETAPITAYAWSLWDQNIGLNQIKQDWFMLAWGAKWLGEKEVMYQDNRNRKDITNDKNLVQNLVKLINKADIVITQNGEEFDMKKLNARAVINGLMPTKPVKSTDILKEGRKVFSFTSHKLEYVADKLNTKYKKLKHSDYPGFDLWKAILAGDKKAWKSMELYCKHDVLSTEEAYTKIRGWIKTQNLPTYDESKSLRCPCGSKKVWREGYAHTALGKFQIYRCLECGKWTRSGTNLLTKSKRDSLLRGS